MQDAEWTNTIDWSRLAEPQADGYDTEVSFQIAAATTTPGRPQLYHRTPVGASPAVFDGQVAVRYVYDSLPEFQGLRKQYPNAPLDHPNLRAAVEYVRAWPVAYQQCKRLLEAIHPAIDPQMPMESAEFYRGSLCHSYECRYGTMWTTIFCPVATAEAIVHEMAHQKLRSIGVAFESAQRIVANDPSKVYVSPVIKDRLRPMTAVIHAEYSYVYVTALDIHLVAAERDPDRREALCRVLDLNLSRIEEGRDVIAQHFEPGPHGSEFMDGFLAWIDRTIRECRELLGRRDVREMPRLDFGANTIQAADRAVEVLMRLRAPRIVVLGNVLSDEECDELIEYCEPKLERSTVIGDAQGTVQVHPNRTSSGAELARGATPLVARIEERLAAIADWPADRGEGLQILRYGKAEEYRPHHDWIDPAAPGLRRHLETGGQRVGTIILYLSEVDSGGVTAFPDIGLEIGPKKGSALFFRNIDDRGEPDPLTLHGGMPVTSGVKYIATKWLRERAC